MPNQLAKLSLRTRLWLLALLATGAFVVVAFVAWRLARATEAFAARQAEWTLHATTNALADEIRMYPRGRNDLPDTLSVESPAPRPAPRPVPPHEREILRQYSDPFVRSGALALHRFPEARGGFLRGDGSLTGVTSQANDGSGFAPLTSEERALLQSLTTDSLKSGEAARAETRTTMGRALFAVVPLTARDERSLHGSNDGTTSMPIVAVWARVELPNQGGAGDWLNGVALALLLLSVSLIVLFTGMTLRALNRDVSEMRQGLHGLSSDLDAALPAPRTPELQPVAGAINELAADLSRNVEQRQALQERLARQERLAALGRVVAGVAHEVRNPLASMRLKMQTTRRADFPREKLERTFAVVIEEIDRLDSLVRRLLELGRPGALHLTQFDVCELARERVALVAEIAARQNVEVSVCEAQTNEAPMPASRTNVYNGACVIDADRERLAQGFDNLFHNALNAMPQGGALKVTCTPMTDSARADKATGVRVSISDTGIGVAPELRPHLFEPFQTNRAEGTGLGLAITREIIGAHGGTIRLADEATRASADEAHGATFIIELPSSVKATAVESNVTQENG